MTLFLSGNIVTISFRETTTQLQHFVEHWHKCMLCRYILKDSGVSCSYVTLIVLSVIAKDPVDAYSHCYLQVHQASHCEILLFSVHNKSRILLIFVFLFSQQ